jgi:hypothetical protein
MYSHITLAELIMRLVSVVLAAACLAAPAFARQHGHAVPPCAAMDAALPAGFEDWNGGSPLTTASAAGDAETLMLGKSHDAGLAKRDAVALLVEPEKPGGSVSYSGVFAFDAPEADNYAVALSTAAWVDVVEDGKAVGPLSFGRGPECTTIRKIVVYPLKAGRHILQIASNGADTAKLLVVKQH